MTTQVNANFADFVGTWTLNNERTSVNFRARALGLFRAKGSLRATQGSAHVGTDGRFAGEIVLDPASIDTNIKKRDDHLRSADFFDVAHFPTITITITELRHAPSDNVIVVGNVVVHGRSTPLTLLAKLDRTGESANLTTEVGITKAMLGMRKANLVKSWVTVDAHFDRA
ncbi:MAG TPA: YceI family protein [Acidimicrobiales bacterium]